MNQEEIWRDIPNYEGRYKISSTGIVKSTVLIKKHRYSNEFVSKEIILKTQNGASGYKKVSLSKGNIIKNANIHQLVAIAFLGHVPNQHKSVVDHINHDKHDNRVENLRIVTQRENSGHRKNKGTSKYNGVHWCKRGKRWVASIRINNKLKSLGYYKIEHDAHLAHEKALNALLCQTADSV